VNFGILKQAVVFKVIMIECLLKATVMYTRQAVKSLRFISAKRRRDKPAETGNAATQQTPRNNSTQATNCGRTES